MPEKILTIEPKEQTINKKKRKATKKKKPWWRRLLAVLLVIAFLWAAGHFTMVYLSHIIQQNLTTIVEAEDNGQVSIEGLTAEEQAQTLQAAYELSAAAYSPSSDTTWSDQLRKDGYDNIQRVENGVSFLYHYIVMRERSNVAFLFSSVNATVATKSVTFDGKNKTLVAVAFRGTDVADAVDDFSDMFTAVNNEGLHKGFAWNAENFFKQRSKISFEIEGERVTLGEIFESMKREDSPYVLLATGHSLGAAVADVFVGNVLYKEGVVPSNVAAFTFGAPKSAVEGYSYPHKNIINIINADDIVPTVGADRQIGQNLVFRPDEAFRAETYGDAYSIGSELGTYNDVISAAATGFIGHNMVITYQAVANKIVNNAQEYFSN